MIDPYRPPTVRDARPGDLDTLVFFNQALAAETESKPLDPAVLARGVASALADPTRLRYWVAEIGAAPVGQLGVTREWSDWRAGWIWWLQSVYVHPEFRRLGVFRAMHAQVRGLARGDRDVIGLRLYVEAGNAQAQETYRARGLGPGGYQVFEELWADRFAPGPEAEISLDLAAPPRFS